MKRIKPDAQIADKISKVITSKILAVPIPQEWKGNITSLTNSLGEKETRNLLNDCASLWVELHNEIGFAILPNGQIDEKAKIAVKVKKIALPKLTKLPKAMAITLSLMIAQLNENSARVVLGMYSQLWSEILLALEGDFENDVAVAGVLASST